MRKLIITLLLVSLLILGGCTVTPEPEEIDVSLNAGQDTIELNQVWIDNGATLQSDSDTITVYTTTTIDTASLGVQEAEYTISYDGSTYTITRYITINDQTAPVISLNTGLDTVLVNESWTDAGCSVTDNSLETLTCTTIDTVDTSTAGVYTIIYTSTDSSGNIGSTTRIVHVIE